MNRKTVIGISAAAVVAVIVGAVAITQGARLKTAASVAKSAAMNEEQVTAKSDENAQITQEIQEQYQIPEIQLTPEMEEAIANGTMTLQEAAAQLLAGASTDSGATEVSAEPVENNAAESSAPPADNGTTEPPAAPADNGTTEPPAAPVDNGTTEPPAAPANDSQSKAPAASTGSGAAEAPKTVPAEARNTSTDSGATEPPKASTDTGVTQAPQQSEAEKAKAERDAQVQNLYAQLYVLRDSFSSRVDGIINECIQEFLALEPEKQTRATKIAVVYKRMDTFQTMERECDAQVEDILAQLAEIDSDLAAKARQYYNNEKELKKASLLAQYGG